MKEQYTKRVAAFLNTFLEKEGYELVKTEFVEEDHNWYLRAYIDLLPEEIAAREAKAAARALEADPEGAEEDQQAEAPGVGINDCVKVSRRLSKWLDQEDFIKEAYTLEVCSRGFLTEADTEETEKL